MPERPGFNPAATHAPANDRLRLGLIGFGRLARDFYVPSLQKASTPAEIVAVADPLESSRESAVKTLGNVQLFADHRAMLETVGLDGLLIASPPSHHLAAWNDAAASGVRTFLEKPFLLPGQLCEALASSAARPLLMLNFNRRFWPAYRRIRDAVRGGMIGEFQTAELSLVVNPAGWDPVTSHRDDSLEGGALYDLGGHLLDLAWFMIGRDARNITARKIANGLIEIDIAFEGGGHATCRLGYSMKACEAITVRGSKSVLRIDNPNFALHRGTSSISKVLGLPLDAAALAPRVLNRDRSMTRFTIGASLNAFHGSLRSGEPFPISFNDAERSARWLELAADSLNRDASTGRAGREPSIVPLTNMSK